MSLFYNGHNKRVFEVWLLKFWSLYIDAYNVIKVWGKVFALCGYPKEIKTDNDPPFLSYWVRQLMLEDNIKHRKILSLWLRENAISERFMINIKNMKNKINKTSWRDELEVF